MNILIAEDERITRRTLQRYLEEWGHTVTEAEDGQAAWELFQKQTFDMVITDWDMPRMDGQELLAHIRSHEENKHYVYMIMLTGRSETEDVVNGMEAGADDFLVKPFDKSELRVRLNAGQRIIMLERELAQQNQVLSAANRRMKKDLDAAARMQYALLPQELPNSERAFFAWHYEPCDELGGDSLNVVPLDEDHIALYLFDVSGHGVPAALLSVAVNRQVSTRNSNSSLLFADNANEGTSPIRRPSDVAEQLNQIFQMDSESGKYFTLFYGVLNIKTRILQYTLAGHPAPILLRGNKANEIEGTNFAIGMFHDATFSDCTLQLEAGDRLFIYSDGITEAHNQQKEMLDPEGMIQLLQNSDPSQSLPKHLHAFIDRFNNWTHGPLQDDISVLAMEVGE